MYQVCTMKSFSQVPVFYEVLVSSPNLRSHRDIDEMTHSYEFFKKCHAIFETRNVNLDLIQGLQSRDLIRTRLPAVAI